MHWSHPDHDYNPNGDVVLLLIVAMACRVARSDSNGTPRGPMPVRITIDIDPRKRRPYTVKCDVADDDMSGYDTLLDAEGTALDPTLSSVYRQLQTCTHMPTFSELDTY